MEDINHTTKPRNGKVIAGLILLVIGGLLLLNQLDFWIAPNWLFSPPMWLIVIGLFIGARNNWRKPIWLLLVLIGFGFLLNHIFPGFDAGNFVWPIVIIALGIWMIVRRNHKWDKNRIKQDWTGKWDAQSNWRNYTTVDSTLTDAQQANADAQASAPYSSEAFHSPDDYLDATAIFGGVNKTILSKNFKGGDITNIFGGTELDFSQADINGRVVIDITQVFGGTKIIVPANWQVVSDLAAVFAGVDDKRIRTTTVLNNDKVLVLKGTSIFAGVDIRSF